MSDLFKVAEKFISINGEGTKAGQTAVFVRFTGCNLNCSYCDTKWASEQNAPYTQMSSDEIISYIKNTGIKNVTLTGGEPLIQNGIENLIKLIADEKGLCCEIETNGSVDISKFINISNPPSFTMDYKLPLSGMEKFMNINNFSLLTKRDTVKFVSGNLDDLHRAKEIMDKYNLYDKTNLYISPVFDSIEPVEIVNFMIKNKMNNVNLQLQLHKIIWNAEMRGV